ncbi:MAG: dual specificity protein phosphatase family protein [Candidatus Obscuribacter sp.]|jgi:protein tyrosine/serine phosphatase|nr:dual specificity protein phosphatase family protein [Candidatus Obscuribacter sp.]MDQ5966480.1 Dual specificity protein phosphatase family protein [Cyanobacteriota bacterium erpe_2018_sw_39hr_WHONDRS-SW48-000098_B_bin.30]MBK9619280.1 dual specificity protein phosphatase family protein [Candidatus Obscuribacter sp.]MBL0184770.1 dual specificity protein phosphatase family protein [Candidatus Obscuribacter sp.]MBP6350855.1 dual specificity protein phosphatase family protein [Candidatus Obscurib
MTPTTIKRAKKALQIMLVCAGFTIITVSQTVSAQPLSAVDAPKPELKNQAKADLPNFHQVHPYLYRGGEPTSQGLKALKDKGIKTIIDLRAETPMSRQERNEAKTLGLDYINLPMSDKAPTDKQVKTFIDTTRLARDNSAPVFVHCAHGSDRTGCLIGIWRVTEDNYSYDQAYKEMRKYWFGPKFVNLSQAVQKRATRTADSTTN